MIAKPRATAGKVRLADVAGPMLGDLAKRLSRVAGHAASVRTVHRLRSEARRLLAFLDDVLGPHGRRRGRGARSMIRRLRRRAGKIRDCDVSLEIAAREITDGLASRAIHDFLELRRERAAGKLAKTARRCLKKKLPERLRDAIGREILQPSRVIAALERRRRRVFEYAATAARSPRDTGQLHALRLAVKKFRDTAGFFALVSPSAREAAEHADALSDHLGHTQDLAVLRELLTQAAGGAAPGTRTRLLRLRRGLDQRLRDAQRSAADAARLLHAGHGIDLTGSPGAPAPVRAPRTRP